MTEARLILTCGLPGAGKTALARQLAADRSAVRLTKDEWLWALGSTPWDEPTREKIEHELWRLAQEILRLGLSVVLDFGLWERAERVPSAGCCRAGLVRPPLQTEPLSESDGSARRPGAIERSSGDDPARRLDTGVVAPG